MKVRNACTPLSHLSWTKACFAGATQGRYISRARNEKPARGVKFGKREFRYGISCATLDLVKVLVMSTICACLVSVADPLPVMYCIRDSQYERDIYT